MPLFREAVIAVSMLICLRVLFVMSCRIRHDVVSLQIPSSANDAFYVAKISRNLTLENSQNRMAQRGNIDIQLPLSSKILPVVEPGEPPCSTTGPLSRSNEAAVAT